MKLKNEKQPDNQGDPGHRLMQAFPLSWKKQAPSKPCCCCVASVVSDSVRPHRRQPTRLPRPWASPGKNTRVGCHFLLQCMQVKSESEVAQSCPTPRDPMDCSLPGSSIHGIFQAKVLEWGAIAFSEQAVHLPATVRRVSQWQNSFLTPVQSSHLTHQSLKLTGKVFLLFTLPAPALLV